MCRSAAFVRLSEDPDDFELTFTAVGGGGGFGPTAATSPEEFVAAYKKVAPEVEGISARLARLDAQGAA